MTYVTGQLVTVTKPGSYHAAYTSTCQALCAIDFTHIYINEYMWLPCSLYNYGSKHGELFKRI